MAIALLALVRSKGVIISLPLLLGCFFAVQAHPAQAIFRIALDQETIQAGYTVTLPSGRFSLDMPATVFNENVEVSVQRPSNYLILRSQDTVGDWLPIGKIKTYNIQVKNPSLLATPVWVSMRIPAHSEEEYFLAFYDRVSGEWKELPSTLNWFDRTVTAPLPFPYATVSVFSKPSFGPKKNTDFKTVEEVLGSPQAAAIFILDDQTGQVLFEYNADEQRSIASLTKISTSWVALQHAVDWNQVVTYQDEWSREGGALRVVAGETLSVGDMLYSTLVGSANNTAVGLANFFLDQDTFLAEMNSLTSNLGLSSTIFVEPSGLDAGNVSTAREYALLARAALHEYDMLTLTTTLAYSFTTPITGAHHIHTTNLLLLSDLYLTGGKTGYTDEALYCLMIKAKSDDGHDIIVVVLGSPSSSARFSETAALAQWTFDNYTWN